ncbi:MAG: phosphatidate cytidylyltransferase [Bacteroidia bacterium]|nr:phosphatidate cytidylyltransferase [Bacteroidia bacterium]
MKNVVVRTISGVGFVLVILACLLINRYLFAAFIILMMISMMHEFYRMTMGDLYRNSRIIAIATGVTLFLLIFFLQCYGLPAKFISCALVPLLVLMVYSLYEKDRENFGKFPFIYTGLLYIAAPLSLVNLLAFDSEGNFSAVLLLCFFIINWGSDIGAFCFGTAFGQKEGRRKLFPSISPKKSWVGFWGGLFLALVFAAILHFAGIFHFPLCHCLGLAVTIHIGGVYGDLFESQWKRWCSVKDAGNIIPGHGGMLDRFDSTIFAVCCAAIYLVVFNLF